MNKPFVKNQIIQLEITGITHEGNGVGRFGSMVVFVPMSAPGDLLEARIIKVLKTHAFGRISKIIKPSQDRVEDTCPVYKRCGGCVLRHISYESEAVIKEDWVRENLRRIGKINVQMDDFMPSASHERYRNKAQLPIRRIDGKICAGFFARRSHEAIPVRDCLLQPKCFGDITAAFTDFLEQKSIEPYDEADNTGLVRHLYLRIAEATGQVMVCVVINGADIPYSNELVEALKKTCPDIATVVLNTNRSKGNVILGDKNKTIYGSGYITDILCGIKVDISPQSFYQVNHSGAEAIYKKALEYAEPKPDDTLLDLYCGAGTIGLSMAANVKELIGIEVVEVAVADAKKNAVKNNISNAEFICADAEKAVKELKLSPDIIVLDPPRKGVDKTALNSVAMMNPEKIVYISCNSATLARDCAHLGECGYKPVRAVAADMFPRTAHVETVVLLSKLKSTTSIEVKIDLDEMDLTKSESKATYDEIKAYVLEQTGLKVSQLYIAQVKRKHGIIERENYNTDRKSTRLNSSH